MSKRKRMPDGDDRSEAVNDHVDSCREEGDPVWDCDWDSGGEWTDADDERVEREGY